MDRQDVTVSLPASLRREVRHFAIDQGVSLSHSIALLLEQEGEGRHRYQAAKVRQVSHWGRMEGSRGSVQSCMAVDRGARITIDLGDRTLYRAVQHAAIDQDESVREFVIKALRLRLEQIEDEQDAEASREVLADPTEEYVPLDQVKQDLGV